MGISTFTSKEFVIFCRVSKIGNVMAMAISELADYFYGDFCGDSTWLIVANSGWWWLYPLVMTNVRELENGTFSSLIYLLKMVIFHSYVCLPEGMCDFLSG